MASAIDTLGKAARHRMVLRVTCRKCQNRGFFKASDLMTTHGGGRSPHMLPFSCRKCGRRNFEVTVLEVDLDRSRNLIVWVPQRLG